MEPTASRDARLRGAQELLAKREWQALARTLRALYWEAVPPRRLSERDSPIVRLYRRFSAVLTGFLLVVPLSACYLWAVFGRWGFSFASGLMTLVSLVVAFYVGAFAGYVLWRPRQGAYAWLLLAGVIANTVQWVRYPPGSIWQFLMAHVGGSVGLLVVLGTTARRLVFAAPGGRLAYLVAAGTAAWSLDRFLALDRAYVLPLVAGAAILTGPLWSKLFPPQPARPPSPREPT